MREGSQRVKAWNGQTGGERVVARIEWVKSWASQLQRGAELRAMRAKSRTPVLLETSCRSAKTRRSTRSRGCPVSPQFTARVPMLECAGMRWS